MVWTKRRKNMKRYNRYRKNQKKKTQSFGNLEYKMNPKKHIAIYNRLYRAAEWFAQAISECTGKYIDPKTILRQSGYKI